MATKQKIDKLLKFRFGLKYRINMYKRLESYTKEEFPIYDSLVKFKARYDKKKDFRGKIIGFWLEKMKHGQSFPQAISGWIPDAELNLITAGDEGNGVEKGLAEAIKFAQSAQKIKSVIIAGSAYPLILLFVVLGFIAMFSVKMAPTYLSILPVEKWPDLGQNFYYFSSFLVSYWYIVLGIFVGAGIVIGSTITKWTGPVREVFDKFPPWSVYKVYQSSAFLISLASMMQSGTPLNDALKKIKRTSSPWMGLYMDDMMRNLRKGGQNFGQHLNVGLLDDETAGDVIDYSELGKFEEAIYSIGEDNLESSVQKIELRMNIVKNLMIALVGITVGVIYYTTIELNGVVADAASSNSMSLVKHASPTGGSN
jgi:type II secretory pathway component PulF